MVNYGRSRACSSCKKRRVKCDETRPSCQRCTRIGRSCSGYIDDWDLALRSGNNVIAGKIHSMPMILSSPSNIIPSNLESWAIRVFYRDYVLESYGDFPGWLHFLPKMYEQASHGSILRLSVRSAAFANYAQKTGRKDVEILAIAAYNRALNMAGTVLTTSSQIPAESTMTAIFLLGLYENITSKVVESPRLYHSLGLGAVADLRGKLLLEGNGQSLLEIVCCQRQRRNLDVELGPTSADIRLVDLLRTASPASRAISNCFEVSKFIAWSKQSLAKENFVIGFESELQLRIQELEQRFQLWDEEASIAISSSMSGKNDEAVISSRPREAAVDPYPAYLFSLWNKNKAARILVHQKFLEILATSQKGAFLETDAHRLHSLSKIRSLVDEIIDNVPATLKYGPSLCSPSAPRSVGGYINIWPLQIVLRCPYIDDAQRVQAMDSLEKSGLECGLSYAVVYARSFWGKR